MYDLQGHATDYTTSNLPNLDLSTTYHYPPVFGLASININYGFFGFEFLVHATRLELSGAFTDSRLTWELRYTKA